MKVRRVVVLAEQPDEVFLESLAEGSRLALANAEVLYGDAEKALAGGATRGYFILRAQAEEEAAKSPILLDAARCPPGEGERRSAQLRKFSDHLSRMICSEVCHYRPKDFAELEAGVADLREEYYLDGPSGLDWIYRNRLLQEREGTLYVDYVEGDGERRWDGPKDWFLEKLAYGGPLSPASLTMAARLGKAGFFTDDGIKNVADIWRPCVPQSNDQWGKFQRLNVETLRRLGHDGPSDRLPSDDFVEIRDNWPFPLWPMETKLKEVRYADLEEARRALAARYPDGY
jgi:AbiV family abortive infection protein